ncbi:MAG: hypothetical protein A2622_10660 [Bdellovibrionales bacterium RIFCSPHIGHO2_01_FULL_40_29]|nr:MAG: hypothetical protein A2622_10660 [Bdellovibrionales bacterium RIFCSPHIGHO2_01_FULL_40_29]OFZ34420.1 MAG: hypothetical protein A3D17_00925 [Bdellovibrionales bacterium RIFCSPHIGHO2_02_FULL_40_15]
MFDYGIVILSYNHPELTAKTVRSVLQFHFPKNKILLVHNGSDLKHRQMLTTQFPDINHHEIQFNQGFTGGANAGLTAAFNTHSEILFLTNDTEVITLPPSFPKNLDYFSIKIWKRNTNTIDSIIGEINLKTGQLRHIREINSPLKKNCAWYIPGTAFGIKKTAFLTLKGFNESFHTYWEDVDMSLRAHHLGLRIGTEPDFEVKHRIGKTCHKHRFYTLYLFQRNRQRVLKIHGQSEFHFYIHFYFDMLKLLLRILSESNKSTNLRFWWKALRDTIITA